MTNPYEAPGGTFGPDPDEPGDSETGEAGDERPPTGDLGGGHFLRVNEEAWRALLHHPTVVAAITARANAIADQANSNVGMDPRAIEHLSPDGDPAYVVTVQNRSNTSRARARVRTNPDNMLGVVDDAHHSTLFQAMLAHPSDPIPEGAEAQARSEE
ncbi:hypothetical protein VT930_11845 [Mycobacterium sherrisii]|uniref:hypothetical protein n=1 Tax=Mycobacterium sherrisii TaxID=243061 RepID=UPI002DDCDB35|nr:hypothetical protein [Mycobacterium sherrisii]MEC4763796.1 hypothetical protein [Mycobacterium sherrisii]